MFHYALEPEGYLMLGTSETVERSELFSLVSKKHSLYRRRNVPVQEPQKFFLPRPFTGHASEEIASRRLEPPVRFGAIHEKMVERYAPPSILVNEQHETSESMNEELATANQENRHRLEELNQLTGDLQNLLAATQIATLFLDRELRILRFTPPVTELFNLRLSDRGRPLTDLTHRLGPNTLQDDARRVLARLVPVERELLSEDGRWYLTRLNPYRTADDRIDGVVVTFIDVTDQKRYAEALRESEQRYHTLFESIDEGFCICEMLVDERGKPYDYRWLEVNPSWEHHTGLPDAAGKTARQLVPDLEPHWFEIYGKVALTREPIRFQEGSEAMGRWFEVYAFPVEEPALRRFAILFTDITERRRVEAALQEMNASLERQVAERTAVAEQRAEALRRLATQLSQVEERERRRLARRLHDDLQQLLIALKMRLRGLAEDQGGRADQMEKLDELVDECLRTSSNLTQELGPPILQVGGMLDVIQWLGHHFAEAHGMEVAVEAVDELAVVPEHVRVFVFHAVRELLTNVGKHAGTRKARITLSADNGFLVIEVEDDGRAFDPQVVEARLVQPEGFGLFHIRERLEALGGRLDIARGSEGGAHIGLVIPWSQEVEVLVELTLPLPAEALSPPARGLMGRSGVVRVLVVDDHAVVREGFVSLLNGQRRSRSWARPSTGRTPCNRPRRCGRTWSSWTSICPTWTAWRPRGRSSSGFPRPPSWHSPFMRTRPWPRPCGTPVPRPTSPSTRPPKSSLRPFVMPAPPPRALSREPGPLRQKPPRQPASSSFPVRG